MQKKMSWTSAHRRPSKVTCNILNNEDAGPKLLINQQTLVNMLPIQLADGKLSKYVPNARFCATF